jgi:hypothetical protein
VEHAVVLQGGHHLQQLQSKAQPWRCNPTNVIEQSV